MMLSPFLLGEGLLQQGLLRLATDKVIDRDYASPPEHVDQHHHAPQLMVEEAFLP